MTYEDAAGDFRRSHMSEVWCSVCNEQAEVLIRAKPYCKEHGSIELWKINSPAWNPRRSMKEPR